MSNASGPVGLVCINLQKGERILHKLRKTDSITIYMTSKVSDEQVDLCSIVSLFW